MPRPDDFANLARYYDPIMEHVDYDRWFVITTALAELAPDPFLHLDAGCGTGVLLGMLRKIGWSSVGIDLSLAMLQTGRRRRGGLPVAAADLRALPFRGEVDLMTCLFDSMNFLLKEADVERALCSMSSALAPGGVLYFDVVTERMVTQHFEGRDWEEDNRGFHSAWKSRYDRRSAISETNVRVNSGGEAVIRERIYPVPFLEQAVRKAGLDLVGVYDADTWNTPTRRTTRVDFIAMRGLGPDEQRRFTEIRKQVRQCLY